MYTAYNHVNSDLSLLAWHLANITVCVCNPCETTPFLCTFCNRLVQLVSSASVSSAAPACHFLTCCSSMSSAPDSLLFLIVFFAFRTGRLPCHIVCNPTIGSQEGQATTVTPTIDRLSTDKTKAATAKAVLLSPHLNLLSLEDASWNFNWNSYGHVPSTIL